MLSLQKLFAAVQNKLGLQAFKKVGLTGLFFVFKPID